MDGVNFFTDKNIAGKTQWRGWIREFGLSNVGLVWGT